jgi:hypothetical protein
MVGAGFEKGVYKYELSMLFLCIDFFRSSL